MLETLNINLWDIINIITGCIDWIIFFLAMSILGKKNISFRKYTIYMILVLVFMSLVNFMNIFPNFKIIICIVIGSLFYIASYKESIYKCILISLLFWLGLMMGEGLAIGIVVVINQLNNIDIILNGNLFRLESIVISKIFLFIIFISIKYFKLSIEFKPKDMVLIGLPILSNIVSLLLIFGYNLKNNSVSDDNIFVIILSTLLIVSSSIIILIVIGKIVQDDKVKLEYELINERIKIDHKSYESINEIHDKLKYVYHDLKNHMICIKNYDTKEEIISYVNNLENKINDFEYFRNTGNKTLDIILGEKIYLCKKYNIEFEDSINISKLQFIQDVDICAIFANALDNAIEACMKMNNNTEKRIEVKATYVNGFAIIKFINTKVNDIKFIDERIKTSKDNNRVHGIGLASIKYMVSKYDGELTVNYSDNEFILKIMIPIKD
ncbi:MULTISPECIES: GHKL domain-containing protein [unclassified Clostridioides]|uniref:GHKL domain-containing protein n=1 Tax=unclassified Clostridioides TaxID=2635829 RepID=UPI001D0F8596|nr:GHKL domain-containing protein [Clostridioides sp. ES-S-0171-01]UDN55226.1 GHKL domain-containing protein [Clostridioides sp. ES-S-0054-01]